METVAPSLIVYGPLGIITLVLLYAVVALYKSKEAAQKEHRTTLEKLHKDYQARESAVAAAHKREMDDLMTRHITKAESWVEKGTDLANNLKGVLESLSQSAHREG